MTAVVLAIASRRATVGRVAAPRTVDDVFVALGAAVHGYLRGAGGHESEDLVSEVFVRIARRIDHFQGTDDDLRRWVFTIAHNCLVDEHRRRHRHALYVRTLTLDDCGEPVEPFDPDLITALAELTPDQREVVTLRFIADLAIEDVARITRRPTSAVKSLQHRGLRTLAGALNRTSKRHVSTS